MTGVTDLCHPEAVRVAASHQAEARKIAAELAAIARTGMVLPGSITERRTRCGHRNCACHADPPRLRGLLARLETLGAAALDADPRWQRKPRATPADTGPASP